MGRRFLVGPVTATFADQNFHEARQRGDCFAFSCEAGADLVCGPADSWPSLLEHLPQHWQPDFIALYLPYTTVPPALWSGPP
jgi:hypothetical protein